VNTILTEDGLALEAEWDETTDAPKMAMVLCHPHPLDGGTMRAPLMESVASNLAVAGAHVLRFNFRGVGASEGSWGQGTAEIRDVDAAVVAAGLAYPELPLGIAGWSFGATTSLAWQLEHGSTVPWVGIAPGIRSYRGSQVPDFTALEPARRLIIMGDRDQFASVDDMTAFARSFDAEVEVLGGSDHFFYFRETDVAQLAAGFLLSGSTSREG
jgi:alpha/beta superfamily hydrolase